MDTLGMENGNGIRTAKTGHISDPAVKGVSMPGSDVTEPAKRAISISTAGLDLLKRAEGLRHFPYRDSAGLLTIGYGHMITRSELSSGMIRTGGKAVRWTNGISDGIADQLLLDDVAIVECTVCESVSPPLSQCQFDALCVFTYNIGNSAFRTSTLLRMLNEEKYWAVPDQLRRWVYCGGRVSKGLQNRREFEIKLWLGGTA